MVAPLVVRADASSRIGTGHVMRCMALAQAWPGKAIFLSHELPAGLQQRLSDAGIQYVPVDSPLDPASALAVMDQHEAQWLVVDGYPFDISYQTAVRQAGKKLFLIDDYAHLPAYEADVLFNQNVTAIGLDYTINPDALLMLGPRYCLLRPEFHERPAAEPPAVAHNLLVTLGGSDPDNVTLSVMEAVSALHDLTTRVVIGAANPHRRALEQVAAHHGIELLVDVRDMPALMRWADIAITSGGTTCWELAFMGLPALVMSIAENQDAIADRLGKSGAMIGLGRGREIDPAALVDQVRALARHPVRRMEMRQMQQLMVDGRGAERVVRLLAGQTPEITLRPVNLDDAYLLWEWANDPLTRANSFNSASIPWEIHLTWLQGKLASPDNRFWVMELHSLPVGLIRYELKDSATATIAYQIAPGFRGRGLGTRLLALTEDAARRELGATTLEGLTFAHNIPSGRAFLKRGFHQADGEPVGGYPTYVFTKSI